MAAIADLREAAERLRRRARLARIQARLVRFSGELDGCPTCREQAGSIDQSADVCEQAAELVLAAIEVHAQTYRMVHGFPPQPDRPSLRVVGGGDESA